ncbi:MAG: LTA synthase family protein [Alkalibacterium gilvum]|uniref:Lipoteichoic acid synthase n=2 Tax=Alkalibacterium TaxID=99906 RepID=A0A1H6TCX2_9LACT|nr:LTA synthase family protein [Alkalibacterium gilvum]SEI76024.1 lipoteichoic acid synthase [Alkalibacterium gilvum]
MFKKKQIFNRRNMLFGVVSIFLWLKTYAAYWIEFDLGVSGVVQNFLLFINPLAIILILFSISLYFKKPKTSFFVLLGFLFAATLLLYANVLYYREFSDFLTTNILVGSNNVSKGVIASTFAMMRPWDFIYWFDIVLLVAVYIRKRKSVLKLYQKPVKKREIFAVTALGLSLFVGNLTLAEIDRPQLLTRTFDRNYIVKYMGLNFFSGYDLFQTAQNSQIRASADETQLNDIIDFTRDNYKEPNPEYFGAAKDKNVIVIAMESVQQFVINYELEDENGVKHEVMPFVNSLYNNEDSYSFSNFFHQTGQGKSSDAEVLAETSLYGLSEGSAFQTLGSTNSFHAAPAILEQKGNYTSAAFHGNVGSFWNRTDTYRNFGYDYFFDSAFYNVSGDRSLEYGLKDKLFFKDSVEYIEKLPQPFYTKFVTVTNHFPYPLDEKNQGFPLAQTSDDTINQYFATANYLDQAIEEFFNYLKNSGLYEDSIVVLYGDHYGISNMRNPRLAELVGKEEGDWNEYDDAQMQRVPLIMHVPGAGNGKEFETFSGQVDMLPTLLHLLGMETDEFLFMGQDLLSGNHDNTVPLRNGRVMTEDYTFIGQTIYDKEGTDITDTLSEKEIEELHDIRDRAREELSHSNQMMMLDLLRFYTPSTIQGFEPNDYIYADQLDSLNAEDGETLLKQRDGLSSETLYESDAPELIDEMNYNEFLETLDPETKPNFDKLN